MNIRIIAMIDTYEYNHHKKSIPVLKPGCTYEKFVRKSN